MPSRVGTGQETTREVPPQLLIIDTDPERAAGLGAPLEARGYRVSRAGGASEGVAALREYRPALVVLTANDPAAADVRAAARDCAIPVLEVVDRPADPIDVADHDADDWVSRASVQAELPVRVGRLLRRRDREGVQAATSLPPADDRFLPLVIHDMRTPLNVIGLSLHMIGQAVPKGDPDLGEDLRFVEENFKQIEHMLAQLSDYYRLFEGEAPLSVSEFNPRRLVSELLEARALKAGSKAVSVRLEVQDSCPAEVALDQNRARMAIQYAVANAVAATHDATVLVNLRGRPDRWVIEVATDRPPSPSVKSVELRPDRFERLCGTAAERRGMDLAIAARVSQMFGGTARLDVQPDQGTTIVLDWPARLVEV